MICVKPGSTLGMEDDFPFMIHNVCYESVLQRILCQRAVLAEDQHTFAAIRHTTSVTRMRELAKRTPLDTELQWEQLAYSSCLEAVRSKYSGACRHELMVEGEFVYIDTDLYWGCGISAAAAKLGIPFRGENMYGQILSRVRSEIQDRRKVCGVQT